MKILIIGTGVIGCIYGWQLSESGNEITHFVRKGTGEKIVKSGILIHCLDTRKQNNLFIEAIYKPNIVEEIDEMNNGYDFIIVPVKANQLKSILPFLSKTNEHSYILFLQNLWINHVQLIKGVLPDSRVIYGQAHIAGGGKRGNIVTCTIFGNKNAPTMIGKENGILSKELLLINEVMREADLNPQISEHILDWLLTHYVEANGIVAGVMEAGTAKNYVSTKKYIKHSIKLIREGLKVCSSLGINISKVYPQSLYFAPMWILIPPLLKMYRTEETQLMMQEHILHSPDEMKEMFYDVFETGNQLGLPMLTYKQMQEHLMKFIV